MRTYELMYIVDPKVPEEEATALADSVKELVKANGGTITRDESWGRRKLAYSIDKQNEGRYFLVYAHSADDRGVNFAAVEHRLEQNDKVLRFLVVRTDGDIQRAKGKVTAELAAGIVPEEAPAPTPAPAPAPAAAPAPVAVAVPEETASAPEGEE